MQKLIKCIFVKCHFTLCARSVNSFVRPLLCCVSKIVRIGIIRDKRIDAGGCVLWAKEWQQEHERKQNTGRRKKKFKLNGNGCLCALTTLNSIEYRRHDVLLLLSICNKDNVKMFLLRNSCVVSCLLCSRDCVSLGLCAVRCNAVWL